MTKPVLILSLAAASAVGLLAGLSWRTEGSAPVPAVAAQARSSQQAAETTRLRTDLEEARREIARKDLLLSSRPEPRAAALKTGPAAGAPEDTPKDVQTVDPASLKAAFEESLRRKDGQAALKSLKALLALGKDAYPAAAECWLELKKALKSGDGIGLNSVHHERAIEDPAFLRWVLTTPALDKALRYQAIDTLAWTDPDGAPVFLASLLSTEEDPRMLDHLIGQLDDLKSPQTVGPLLAQAQKPGLDARMRADAVIALGQADAPEVTPALRLLAMDPEAQVRDAARFSLVVRDPPGAGIAVEDVTPGSQAEQAGLRPGDLLVSYNGQPTTSNGELRKLTSGVAPDSPVTLQILRDGVLQTVTMRGGRIGIDGTPVAPR